MKIGKPVNGIAVIKLQGEYLRFVEAVVTNFHVGESRISLDCLSATKRNEKANTTTTTIYLQ